ncbi:MAG: DUF1800 family protein, partial [Chloroflexota bacterium]|nr:DUF1800 family protein [Chloroflexota bacterium]
MTQPTNRRDLLKRGGAFAATLAFPRDLNVLPRLIGSLDASAPALPPLEVIALNRMAFGARPGDLEAFRALPGSTPEEKLRAYVEQQLNPAQIDDRACDARLAPFETLRKSLEQLWADHVVKNPYADKDADKEWEWRMRPASETRAATLIRAAHSQRQLVEVLADFWHNHFNVYGWDDNTAPVLPHYDRDVIRAHLFGNFRQMLQAVAASPAMLYYLDNAT